MAISALRRQEQLGSELKALRLSTGLTTRQVAARTAFSYSKVSRMETARTACTASDLTVLLELYGADPDTRRHLGRLLHKAHSPVDAWWNAYAHAISSSYAEYIALEHEAVEVLEYRPNLIPSLLQTEPYARNVIRHGLPGISEDHLAALMEVRGKRHRRLTGPQPLSVTNVVTEAALRFVVGGPHVHREQLCHLLTATRDHVRLLIVPFSAGSLGAQSGALTLFRFPGQVESTAAVRDAWNGDQPSNSPREVRRCSELLHRLVRAALPVEPSMALIRKAIADSGGE